MGTLDGLNTNETSNFFATNVTYAEKFRVGFTKSKECSDEALKNALITQVSEARRIITNKAGAKGWHLQTVTQEIEDDEMPVLNDVITGADSNYTLVAFFYDLQEDLVACAHLKKHDEDTAAMYDELLKEVGAAVAAAGDEAAVEDTLSGSKSKNGLFAVVSAFAAIGIAAMMVADVVAL